MLYSVVCEFAGLSFLFFVLGLVGLDWNLNVFLGCGTLVVFGVYF